MKTDDKLIDELLQRYATGNLESLRKDCSEDLDVFDDQKRFKERWDYLHLVQMDMRRYLSAGIIVDEVGKNVREVGKALSLAHEVTIEIERSTRQAVSSLESVLLAGSDNLSGADASAVKQYRDQLLHVSKVASIINKPHLENSARMLSDAYESILADRIYRQAQDVGSKADVQQALSEAKSARMAKMSRKKLRAVKTDLEALLDVDGDRVSAQEIRSQLKRYDDELSRRNHQRAKSLITYLAGSLSAAALVVGLYVGGSSLLDNIRIANARRELETAQALQSYEDAKQSIKKSDVKDQAEPVVDDRTTKSSYAVARSDVSAATTVTASDRMVEALQKTETIKKSSRSRRGGLFNSRDVPISENLIAYLSPVLGHGETVLYISRNKNVSALLSNVGGEYVVEDYFPHTDAVNPQEKIAEGMPGNPEGVYSIALFESSTPDPERLGEMNMELDYPTEEQLKEGYSGSGIQLCAYASGPRLEAITAKRDAMNCGVGFRLEDFLSIQKAYERDRNNFRVVIEDHKNRPLFK